MHAVKTKPRVNTQSFHELLLSADARVHLCPVYDVPPQKPPHAHEKNAGAKLTSVRGHDPLVRVNSNLVPSNLSGDRTCLDGDTRQAVSGSVSHSQLDRDRRRLINNSSKHKQEIKQ